MTTKLSSKKAYRIFEEAMKRSGKSSVMITASCTSGHIQIMGTGQVPRGSLVWQVLLALSGNWNTGSVWLDFDFLNRFLSRLYFAHYEN